MNQIDLYRRAIQQTIDHGPVRDYDFLDGYSGKLLVGTLQRLLSCAPAETVYCEVGVFQGLTLVSVAGACPDRECYGIDNFAYFDHNNEALVLERKKKVGAQNLHLLNSDYEDALEGLGGVLNGRKIGVYFVDGPHDYRSQLMCLELAKPNLHEDAVIVVDDSNYAHVRQANRDFLRTQNHFRLLFENYTGKHPNNMTPAELETARNGWWNGVNVIVGDTHGALDYREPPTVRDRTRFENEHVVHSARFGHLAPELTALLEQSLSGNPLTAAARALRLRSRAKKSDTAETFPTLNMWGKL